MNILMMTNTFTPHVGGVARSVESFTAEYRRRGHRVLVVAPEYPGTPEQEEGVIRIPALQRFNGSDFSVVLPVPGFLTAAVERFGPDVIHSHHPFLVGGAALRLAYRYQVPLVFTHHTRYEQYTHYVPGDSPGLKRFVIRLSTSYANLCDQVIAPSESIEQLLIERGVSSPIAVVPTGVDCQRFRQGSGPGFRQAMAMPADSFVVGHVGRLAPEKNLEFLARSLAGFCGRHDQARVLVVGNGPMRQTIAAIFAEQSLAGRLHWSGTLEQPLLASAYQAMDCFAFASKSETQGMVLTEAMAAGVPVVALDGSGVREVVRDRRNGRLLAADEPETFIQAVAWVAGRPAAERQRLRDEALATAERFSMERCAAKALALYQRLGHQGLKERNQDFRGWTGAMRLIKAEWEMLKGLAAPTPAAGLESG